MVTELQTRRAIWEIDPAHTLVEFSAKHMMFTTVKGRFAGVRGTLWLDDDDLARSSVQVHIDAASLDTGEPQRDGHLRSVDFLDVERYPAITFTSTRVESQGPDLLRVVGELTISGITREVALNTTIQGRAANPWGKVVAGFTADTSFSRKEFGLTWNVALEAGGVLVGDTVKIALEIQVAQQA